MLKGLRFPTVSERGGWDGFVDKRDPDSQNIFLNDATVGVPLPQGPGTYAYPKEKQRFPGHAMTRTWKRNTDRRIVEKNVSGIGITFVNKSIPSATLRNSGKTQSVGHFA